MSPPSQGTLRYTNYLDERLKRLDELYQRMNITNKRAIITPVNFVQESEKVTLKTIVQEKLVTKRRKRRYQDSK